MTQVVIENPVINTPFEEPRRHFEFSNEGITNKVVEARRVSSYFMPIAKPKKKGKQSQLLFDTEWTQDRIEENRFINQVRDRVGLWRQGNYPGVTKTTTRLLEYWNNPERERKLFFCQIEALETAIYLTEAARKYSDTWIENEIRKANEDANPLLYRVAFKMATGSGKTVVMAMLIAWQTLNKLANKQDNRFSDAFLIATPGITIRDRLRVLLPNDPNNYYRLRDIVPGYQMDELGQAKIVITNYHAFQLRERVKAGRLTKELLAQGGESPFKETPAQMVRRVCRELGNKKSVIVINDEAHHCYRRRVAADEPRLKGDDRKEAEKRNEEARVWISGLEAVKAKLGVKVAYDLSATPFFLRGSGYTKTTPDGTKVNEGLLFPWVVSDFSLIDAIESGIVKVPRVPVADDSMTGDQPTYRDLWLRIREHLPKKGRKTAAVSGEPKLPAELQGALHSLYDNYKKAFQLWEQNEEAQTKGLTPPVFIVVCNNTNVSKIVFDYIAGWEKPIGEEAYVQAGALDIFRNDDGHGGWLHRPNTILIDSEQLESGEAMSPEFKKIAAREIDEFKAEYRTRFPGRDADKLTDEDLLREVMNTVGKAGKLGEHVKCVVSVSMLTEGWDANTVTHILGVRAFGTQLLCEQVVGRGLRRMSYSLNDEGKFDAEYAEVYGVPFSFIPCAGGTAGPKPGPKPTRVRALEERIGCEITFPRLLGYRYDIADGELEYKFDEDTKLALSTADIPTVTENAPIVGETSIHKLEELKSRRIPEVEFLLAKLTLEKYFRGDGQERTERPKEHRFDGEVKVWLFPQLLAITRHWLTDCVTCKDNTFKQLLLLVEFAHDASDRIYGSIVKGKPGEKTLMPLLQPYDTLGSTRYVDFDTTRPVYETAPDKCHVSHVVADTESWEQKMAQTLEDMPEVVRYVKNHNLGFIIPYTINGEEHRYYTDFIAHVDDGRGADDLLNLIIEVTGQRKKDKAAKVATARNLWVPAVNNDGSFGRWEFIEIADPWDAANTIRGAIVRR
ncbi:MAG: DEAD/DEAH box helicase family protein [Pirellulaceae bacterium]|nr:DEAD/DEAH box helicase family protein [Pirellulaceae bacterium]